MLACITSLSYGAVYKWIDSSGVVNYTDDPAKIPEQQRLARYKKVKPRKPSWVLIAENKTGYIYESYGFYDENNTVRISNDEIHVPVKMFIDNSHLIGKAGANKKLIKITYKVICSDREISAQENTSIIIDEIQFDNYRRPQRGVTYHESLIPEQLLNIFCGYAAESEDTTN